MPAYVYVIGSFSPRPLTYVGWTLDLDRRLAEHNGKKRGAKSTRARNWILIYAEKYRTRKKAMQREFTLKKDSKFRAQLRASHIPNHRARRLEPNSSLPTRKSTLGS